MLFRIFNRKPPKFCEIDGCELVPTTFLPEYPYQEYAFNKETGVGVHNYRKGLHCPNYEDRIGWNFHTTWDDGKNYSEPAAAKECK